MRVSTPAVMVHHGTMFEKFSQDSRRAVVIAQQQARELGHSSLGTEHLLLGIAAGPGPGARVLWTYGVTLNNCRAAVEQLAGPRDGDVAGKHLPFTARCKKVLEQSLREAAELGDDRIDSEHLLLAILREGGGVAAKILGERGVSLGVIRSMDLSVAPVSEAGQRRSRTPAAEAAILLAHRLAGDGPLGSHHLLVALASSGESMAGRVFAAIGVHVATLAAQVGFLDVSRTTDATPEQEPAPRTLPLSDDERQDE